MSGLIELHVLAFYSGHHQVTQQGCLTSKFSQHFA